MAIRSRFGLNVWIPETLPLAEIVRTRREDLNLSVEDLSDASGYNSSLIEAVEEGSDDVHLHALRQIACALEIPLEFILEQI